MLRWPGRWSQDTSQFISAIGELQAARWLDKSETVHHRHSVQLWSGENASMWATRATVLDPSVDGCS